MKNRNKINGKAQWKKAANKRKHYAKVGVALRRAENIAKGLWR